MALHEKNKIRENLLDDIYSSADLSIRMPKYSAAGQGRIF